MLIEFGLNSRILGFVPYFGANMIKKSRETISNYLPVILKKLLFLINPDLYKRHDN